MIIGQRFGVLIPCMILYVVAINDICGRKWGHYGLKVGILGY